MPSVSHLYFRLQACTPSGILEVSAVMTRSVSYGWWNSLLYLYLPNANVVGSNFLISPRVCLSGGEEFH